MIELSPPQSRRLAQLQRWLETDGLRPARPVRAAREPFEIRTPRLRDDSDSECFRSFGLLLAKQDLGIETLNLLHWVILAGRYPTLDAFRDSLYELRYEGYEKYFSRLWERTRAIQLRSELELASPSRLLVDVTHTLEHRRNSGIQRVVRSLCISLAKQGREFGMFVWDREHRAVLLDARSEQRILDWAAASERPLRRLASSKLGRAARRLLDRKRAPEKLLLFSGNPVLLPELSIALPRNEIYPVLRQSQLLRFGLVLYDLIPIFHPEFFEAKTSAGFPGYLQLVRHADKIAPISRAIASELEGLLSGIPRQLEAPLDVKVIPLAGDFEPRTREHREAPPREIQLPLGLCVGTIEPRKNGKGILRAAILAMKQGHRFELLFAGNPGWLAGDFLKLVESYRSQGYPVGIRYSVSESELDALYCRARFTLFCSFSEGFGLPILESLQRGVPCITSAVGSMQEIADAGGCLTVNPASIHEISAAIIDLLTNEGEYARLRAEIQARKLRSWDEVASEFFEFFSETPS